MDQFWVLLVVGVIIYIYLKAHRMDDARIRRYLQACGAKVISIEWAPFGPGWLGEKSERLYEVHYIDRDGARHVVNCKTSMWTGVYFTGDLNTNLSSARVKKCKKANRPSQQELMCGQRRQLEARLNNLSAPNYTYLNLAIIVAAILYLISQAILGTIYHPLGADTCFRFWLAVDRDVVLSVMDGWGSDGISQFRKHYRLDFLHPFLYGALLYLLMLRFCSALPGARALLVLPWIAAIADVIENCFQLRVLAAGHAVGATTVLLAGSFARSKWVLAAICVLIVLMGIVQTVYRRKNRGLSGSI